MAYALGDLLIRAVMTADSGLAADTVINDFAFTGPAAQSAAQLNNAGARVDDFYNGGGGGGASVADYISTAVSRAVTHRLDYYRISAGPLGSPFRSDPWLGPHTPTATQNLPTEVAGVISFKADYAGALEAGGAGVVPSTDEAIDQGAPATHTGILRMRARRRGRLFIGPLQIQAIDPPPATSPGLKAPFTLALRSAAVRLKAANTADTTWGVWSRRDSIVRPVVDGWTDNAPDTQRRRGFKATSRAVWGP